MKTLHSYLPWYKTLSSISSLDILKLSIERTRKSLLEHQENREYHQAMETMLESRLFRLQDTLKHDYGVSVEITPPDKEYHYIDGILQSSRRSCPVNSNQESNNG